MGPSTDNVQVMMVMIQLIQVAFLYPLAVASTTDHVIINLATPTTPFVHYWKRAFGTGHATLTLRDDWRSSLTQAVTDLGLSGVRGHGIFDDDMGVVIAPRTYNFTLVEDSWRFQVKNNVTPIVELSFMPAILANCTWTSPKDGHIVNPGHSPCNNTSMQYLAITVPPSSFDDWYHLVQALVQHAVDTFGHEEVKKWTFEVWNELWGLNNVQQYMSLYNASALAVKSVSSDFMIGGPATAQLQYVSEFVNQVTAMNLPFDFLSTHMYPTDPQCPKNQEWGPNCLPDTVRELKKNLTNNPASANVPLYLTEYSVGCGVGYPQHDTSGAAAFAFRTISELEGVVSLLSWWTFSDVFEEGTPINQHAEYMNVYGLMTISGIPKPGWRAFQLLHELAGNQRLNATVMEAAAAGVGFKSDANENANDLTTSLAETTCTIEQDTSMEGFTIGVPLQEKNIVECCNACQLNTRCSFWTLNHTTCSLKSSDAGRTFISNMTSGSSHPPPTPNINGTTRITVLATSSSSNEIAIFLSFWSITNSEATRSVAVSFDGMLELDDLESSSSAASSAASIFPFSQSAFPRTATEYRIDANNTNSKVVWEKMGSPKIPSPEQLQTLIVSSKVMPRTVEADSNGIFHVKMAPNSAVVLLLK